MNEIHCGPESANMPAQASKSTRIFNMRFGQSTPLLQRGHFLIPLTNPFDDIENAGKCPAEGASNWQKSDMYGFRNRPISMEPFEYLRKNEDGTKEVAWTRRMGLHWHDDIAYDDGNVGSLTGVAPHYLIGIDVDALYGPLARLFIERLSQLHPKMMQGCLVRIGLEPKCMLIVRTNGPFKRVRSDIWMHGDLKNQLELLGTGQLMVIGGYHARARSPYKYVGSLPTEVDCIDLPMLERWEFRDIVDLFEDCAFELGLDCGIDGEDRLLFAGAISSEHSNIGDRMVSYLGNGPIAGGKVFKVFEKLFDADEMDAPLSGSVRYPWKPKHLMQKLALVPLHWYGVMEFRGLLRFALKHVCDSDKMAGLYYELIAMDEEANHDRAMKKWKRTNCSKQVKQLTMGTILYMVDLLDGPVDVIQCEIERFAHSRIECNVDSCVPCNVLYDAFVKETGLDVSITSFGHRFKHVLDCDRKTKWINGRSERCWIGIRLKQ